jgi:hypothetical protein
LTIVARFSTNKRKENKSLSILSTWHGNLFVLTCSCQVWRQGGRVSNCRLQRNIKAKLARCWFRTTSTHHTELWRGLHIKRMSWLYFTVLLGLVGQTFGNSRSAVRVRVTQKGLDYGMFVEWMNVLRSFRIENFSKFTLKKVVM